jgi:ATP adenylyltransferase
LKSQHAGECLFCHLAKTDEDEKHGILHRGTHCFVVVNAYPYASGHVMAVVNRHVEHFSELSPAEMAELFALVARCEKAMFEDYKPGGMNIGANIGRSAGAGIVGHLHVHLVPRWHGDTNFMTAVGETRVVSEELGETYRRLKKHFTR